MENPPGTRRHPRRWSIGAEQPRGGGHKNHHQKKPPIFAHELHALTPKFTLDLEAESLHGKTTNPKTKNALGYVEMQV